MFLRKISRIFLFTEKYKTLKKKNRVGGEKTLILSSILYPLFLFRYFCTNVFHLKYTNFNLCVEKYVQMHAKSSDPNTATCCITKNICTITNDNINTRTYISNSNDISSKTMQYIYI